MAHKKLTTILGRETKKMWESCGFFSCNSFHNRAGKSKLHSGGKLPQKLKKQNQKS